MKAVIFRKGKGLTYEEVPKPEIGSQEVLIKVANTGFCGSDHSLIESGLLADGCILGHETSGVVVEIGAGVKNHRVGEKVDSRSAALAETFASALHGINCAGSKGGSAIVLGGGPIGLAAIKMLHLLGFGPLILVEPKEKNRELGKIWEADYVFDPLTIDLPAVIKEITHGWGVETVMECSGLAENVSLAVELVAKGGVICVISILFKNLLIKNPLILNLKEFRLTGSFSNTHEENKKCLNFMAEGKIKASAMITDLIPLGLLPAVYKEKIHPGKSIKVMLQIGDEF